MRTRGWWPSASPASHIADGSPRSPPAQGIDSYPASITAIELALDTANAATIAPVWAALLTGSTEARGHPLKAPDRVTYLDEITLVGTLPG